MKQIFRSVFLYSTLLPVAKLIHDRHRFYSCRPQWNDADPCFFKKIPPEIAFLQELAIADDLAHDPEYLFWIDRPFDLGLVITDQIQLSFLEMMDAVHDIAAVLALKEDHIAAVKLPGRRRYDDGITQMREKRGHGAAGDRDTDILAALDDIDEHRKIRVDIDDAASCHFRDLSCLCLFCIYSHILYDKNEQSAGQV